MRVYAKDEIIVYIITRDKSKVKRDENPHE